MLERPAQLEDGGSNPLAPLHSQNVQEARIRFRDDPVGLEAVDRFAKNPEKCFQRHIRETRGEKQPHAPMGRDGWTARLIETSVATEFIKKYEWLRSMGAGTIACIGGFDTHGELFGVECFGKIGQRVGSVCSGVTPEEEKSLAEKTAYLMRGACAPWAHKKAGSWLIKQSCQILHQSHQWQIFFAYSDAAAGEVGIVYQRSHWHYLGTGLGKGKNAYHADYQNLTHPDPKMRMLSSYKINHGRVELAKKLGAPTKDGMFRPWLENHGWTKILRPSHDKGKYVWFEGSSEEVKYYSIRCKARFGLDDFTLYPKRAARKCVAA
jgi:hypothetical protein